MNSAVDTSELLGGFEQVDLARHRRMVLDAMERLVRTTTEALALNADPDADADAWCVSTMPAE
jgi:hypothetical protein